MVSTSKSRYATPYQCLSIGAGATEIEIRTAYKILALQFHPDKVTEAEREEATQRFLEVNAAYEHCLRKLKNPYSAECWEHEEPEDGKGDQEFYEQAPQNGTEGQHWFANVAANAPDAVKRWAAVNEKVHNHSLRRQTQEERFSLNEEYRAAYEQYEQWRRRREAEVAQKKAQAGLKYMSERERRWAQIALNEKRTDPNHDEDQYQDNHDEEEYFYEVPHGWFGDEKGKPNYGSIDWRQKYDQQQTNRQVSAAQQLANFERQVKALEEHRKKPDPFYDSETQKKRRAKKDKSRKETAERLAALKVEEDQHKEKLRVEAQLKLEAKKAAKLEQQKVKNMKLEPVPDNWDDE